MLHTFESEHLGTRALSCHNRNQEITGLRARLYVQLRKTEEMRIFPQAPEFEPVFWWNRAQFKARCLEGVPVLRGLCRSTGTRRQDAALRWMRSRQAPVLVLFVYEKGDSYAR